MARSARTWARGFGWVAEIADSEGQMSVIGAMMMLGTGGAYTGIFLDG